MFGGKIGALFGRKAGASQQQLPAPQKTLSIPQNASYGDFFRTQGFIHPETGPDFVTWYQAVEHPVSGKWLVQEVWRQPNTVSGNPEHVNHRRTLNNGRAVSFEEALKTLGTFELSQPKMGFVPCSEPSVEEMGDTHVHRFALLNGIVFDEHGHPHMTSHGYIVTDGYFAPEKEAAVLDIYKKRAEGLLPWGKAGPLSQFFEAAVLADAPDALWGLKESYVRWQAFTDKMHETVGWLILLQNTEFTGSLNILRNVVLYPFVPDKYVPIKKYYAAARSEAEDMIASLTHINEADKANVYLKFLRSLDVVYEVAYAKYLRINMEKDRKGRFLTGKLTEQMLKAERLCLKQGGSSLDVSSLKAEIIGGQKRQIKGWSDNNMASQFEDIMELSIKGERGRNFSGLDFSENIYYCPDAVMDFLETLKKTGAEFKQQIESEQERIIKHVPAVPALSSPERGPS